MHHEFTLCYAILEYTFQPVKQSSKVKKSLLNETYIGKQPCGTGFSNALLLVFPWVGNSQGQVYEPVTSSW